MEMELNELKKKWLSDPDIRKEYENMELEYQLICSILEARIEKNLTQQELADITGINRSDLSRIENGNANPSLKTIKRVAAGLGKRVEIRFVNDMLQG